MTWFGSVAGGLAALLCLERENRNGDIAATVLLVAGLLFSDAGLPFVFGALVEVALSPRRRQRAFVPVIPAALWALWYLGWGHTAHTFVSFTNAAKLPSYVIDGLSSSISAYPRAQPAVRRDRDARLSPGGAPSSCCLPASPSGASTGWAGPRTGSG